MVDKITKEKIFEVAERYGLEATVSENPGIFIGNKEVDLEELFSDVFNSVSVTKERFSIPVNVIVNKEKSKINFQHVTNEFVAGEVGVA